MLTLRQVDNVVQSNLFVIKGWEHERQEQGATILYTVWTNATSPKLYLGVFRVWEWIDGSGRCGWQPLTETSPEQEKLRQMFHMGMVMPILVNANTPVDIDTPRPDGYELHADNTQGTAIYKRDDNGKIIEAHPSPNPGWEAHITADSFSFEKVKVTKGTGYTGPAKDDEETRIKREALIKIAGIYSEAVGAPAPLLDEDKRFWHSKTFNNPDKVELLRTRFVSVLKSQPSRLDFITFKKIEEEQTAFYQIYSQDDTHLGTVKFSPIDEKNTAITYLYQGKHGEIFDKIKMYFDETDKYYKSLSQDLSAASAEILKPITLNHTSGIYQPGLHPAEDKDKIIKVVSDTLAGLMSNNAVETDSKSEKEKTVAAQGEAVLKNDDAIKRYGTDRDLSLADVKNIVKRCKAFDGKVTEYWREYSQDKYSLETLRKWLEDSRFIE